MCRFDPAFGVLAVCRRSGTRSRRPPSPRPRPPPPPPQEALQDFDRRALLVTGLARGGAPADGAAAAAAAPSAAGRSDADSTAGLLGRELVPAYILAGGGGGGGGGGGSGARSAVVTLDVSGLAEGA